MAFVANNLTVMDAAGLGTVNSFVVFKYTSNDLLNTIYASGYFNSAYKQFHQGDLIIVSADVDGTPLSNILVVTSATAATTVTTTSLSTATLTFNSVYTIPINVTSLATTTTELYYPVPTTGTPLRFYGCSDAAGATGTSTYRLTQVGGSAFTTGMSFGASYTKGALITGTISASPTLTQGTDVIKVDMSATANTGTGAVHMILMMGA